MGKEFIDYKQALELKQLGFDEPCLKEFHNQNLLNNSTGEETTNSDLIELYGEQDVISAPLYQQAFRWFRENHELESHVNRTPPEMVERSEHIKKYHSFIWGEDLNPRGHGKYFDKYEEAELECLKKLIFFVK
jgi:hypothetical protein